MRADGVSERGSLSPHSRSGAGPDWHAQKLPTAIVSLGSRVCKNTKPNSQISILTILNQRDTSRMDCLGVANAECPLCGDDSIPH